MFESKARADTSSAGVSVAAVHFANLYWCFMVPPLPSVAALWFVASVPLIIVDDDSLAPSLRRRPSSTMCE